MMDVLVRPATPFRTNFRDSDTKTSEWITKHKPIRIYNTKTQKEGEERFYSSINTGYIYNKPKNSTAVRQCLDGYPKASQQSHPKVELFVKEQQVALEDHTDTQNKREKMQSKAKRKKSNACTRSKRKCFVSQNRFKSYHGCYSVASLPS